MPHDLLPFQSLAPASLVLLYAAVFTGFLIRGAFGFGSNLPFVVIAAWVLDPHHVIVLAVVVAAFSQVHLAHQGAHSADWPVFRSLIVGLLIGAAVGAAVFAALDPLWLTLMMGALITAILLLDAAGVFARLDALIDLRSHRVAVPLATLSGTVGSISGGGGLYFLAAYLRIACRTRQSLRGTNLVLSGMYQMGRLVALSIAGFVDALVLVEALALLPAVFAGTIAGTRFFHRTTDARYFRAIQFLLAAGALALVAKAVAGMLT